MIHLLLLAIEVLTFVNKEPSVTSFGLKKLRASILKELDRNDYSTPDNNSKGLIIDNKCGLVNNEGVCYFNSVIQSLFCNKSFVLFYIMNDFVDKQVLSKTVQHLAYRMITRSNINPRPYILQLQNHPRLVNHCTTNGGNPLILLEELLMGLYAEIEDEDDLVFTDGSPDKFFIKESHLTTCKKCTKKNEEDVYSVTMKIPFSNTIEESLDFYHNIKNSKVENKYYKCLECKIFTPAVISETKHDVSYPDNLIVVFERVQVKNNVIYSIFQEIEFNKTMTIGGRKYEVYAAICSYMLRKGYHANAIGRKNDRWVLFNDNQLEVFPPNYIDNDIFNNYAWIIFYKKVK